MTEADNPNFNKNHSLDLKPIRLDVYRLACHFEASSLLSNELDGLSSDEQTALFDLEREFFWDEASRILLQSAMILRMLDDESEAEMAEKTPFYCGTLEKQSNTQKLSLREACNKIIHGRKINFDIQATDAKHDSFGPFVYLYGAKGKVEWKATISIRKYLAFAACLLRVSSLAEFLEREKKHGRA